MCSLCTLTNVIRANAGPVLIILARGVRKEVVKILKKEGERGEKEKERSGKNAFTWMCGHGAVQNNISNTDTFLVFCIW